VLDPGNEPLKPWPQAKKQDVAALQCIQNYPIARDQAERPQYRDSTPHSGERCRTRNQDTVFTGMKACEQGVAANRA
jgi:hypothetical protein